MDPALAKLLEAMTRQDAKLKSLLQADEAEKISNRFRGAPPEDVRPEYRAPSDTYFPYWERKHVGLG